MNTTQVRYQRRHMADRGSGPAAGAAQLSREHGPRAELVRHQQQRLEVVVRHAAAHSPFYRRQFAETGALGDGPVQLARLPVLDKPLLMEHFDELVCDPRLRRDELLDWVGQMTRDQLYLNRYRVMLTSGSSGRPGLYVYDAAGWRSISAGMLRSTDLGRPAAHPATPADGLRRRRRPVPHQPPGSRHGERPAPRPGPARHAAAPSAGGGAQRVPTHLSPGLPLRGHVAGRRAARRPPADIATDPGHRRGVPHPRDDPATARTRSGCGPSTCTAPPRGCSDRSASTTRASTSSRTPLSSRTSTPTASRCRPGQPGARLLVTNLYNLVQPLLRLEVTDLVTLDPIPAHADAFSLRMKTIYGRSDDVLSFSARDGGQVAVHPLHFALLTRDPQVGEFQVIQEGPLLRVLVVPRHPSSPAAAGGDDGLETRLSHAIAKQLLGLGVRDPQVTVERRRELARTAGGKLKLVIADPAQWPGEEARVNLRSLAGQRLDQ